MSFLILLAVGLIVGAVFAFLRAYSLLLLVDMVTIATMKSQLDPHDDHPGLLRTLAPALVLTLGGTAGLLDTNPILWLIRLLPAGALTVPVLKRCCRMSWPHAAKTTVVTAAIHALLPLLLYNLGFRFEVTLDDDGVW